MIESPPRRRARSLLYATLRRANKIMVVRTSDDRVCVPVDNPEAAGTLLRPEPMAADASGRRGAAHRA